MKTWQLRVTVDSIRNSCDVLYMIWVNCDVLYMMWVNCEASEFCWQIGLNFLEHLRLSHIYVFACQTNGYFVWGPHTFSKIEYMLGLCATFTEVVFVYLQVRHSGTLFLSSSYHNLSKNITYVRHICNFDQNCICVFVYLSICVFVIMYLHIRYLGTSFLKSSYHHLFKNIAHVVPMCNFDRS